MTTSIRNSDISNLEAKVKQKNSMDDTDDLEKEKWKKQT